METSSKIQYVQDHNRKSRQTAKKNLDKLSSASNEILISPIEDDRIGRNKAATKVYYTKALRTLSKRNLMG